MTLKEEAKALGIKGYHLMKDETLEKAIAAAKNDTQNDMEEVVSVVVHEAPKEVVQEPVQETPIEQIAKPALRVYELKHKARKILMALGMRHRKYLEFVSMYRDYLPEEYAKAKPMIDKFL